MESLCCSLAPIFFVSLLLLIPTLGLYAKPNIIINSSYYSMRFLRVKNMDWSRYGSVWVCDCVHKCYSNNPCSFCTCVIVFGSVRAPQFTHVRSDCSYHYKYWNYHAITRPITAKRYNHSAEQNIDLSAVIIESFFQFSNKVTSHKRLTLWHFVIS